MVRALSIVHNLAAQKRFRQAKARLADVGTHIRAIMGLYSSFPK